MSGETLGWRLVMLTYLAVGYQVHRHHYSPWIFVLLMLAWWLISDAARATAQKR